MRNEQFYKILSKAKVNKLIYAVSRKGCLNNPTKLCKCEAKSVEAMRPNSDDSCIVNRGESWLEWEYDLDIIAPVYNVGSLLEPCIRSIIEQKTKYNYRLILVNDGSKDKETLDILDKYRNHKNIAIYDKENGGVDTARNYGLDMSKGKYIMFVDTDDMLYEGAIDALVDTAEKTDADIVEGAYKNINEDDSLIKEFPHKEGELNLHNDMQGYPWGKVYKRKLFSKIKYQKYCFEDSVIKAVVQPLSTKNIGISNYVYGYRRNRSSISFKVQGNNKSIDSFWITKRIYEDRAELGLELDQNYYEYLLNMVKLTYRRNIHMDVSYHIDLFNRWADFFEGIQGYTTEKTQMKDLELSIRNRNFSLYKLWNEMNMF